MSEARRRHWSVAVAMSLVVWGAALGPVIPQLPNLPSVLGYAAATLIFPAAFLAVWYFVARDKEGAPLERD